MSSSPLASTPDEFDHYLRAQSVASGQLVGSRLSFITDAALGDPPEKSCCLPGNATADDWVRRGQRDVHFPARLSVSMPDWCVAVIR